jgi:hypothetical protein
MKFKLYDKVKCSHKQEGIIVGIVTDRMDWFPYRVQITKATLANQGDIEHYKEEQLKLLGEN